MIRRMSMMIMVTWVRKVFRMSGRVARRLTRLSLCYHWIRPIALLTT